jgi:hypothetical protein
MGFQKAKRDLKAVYDHSNSEYSDNERRKTLYIMFGGSWDITSRRIVKNQCREVAAAVPAPRAAPHHRWMQTSISFDTSDCPKSMVGARQLPLLVSLTIGNVKLYYVLIGGGAALNLISLVAFKKLQIPMLKLQLSRPFSKVGPVPIIQCGCISLPVTFGTPENFLHRRGQSPLQCHFGQADLVPIYGRCPLWVHSLEDAIPQRHPQDPQIPQG